MRPLNARPGVAAANRIVVAVVGALLVATAVVAWFWHADYLGSAPRTLDLASTRDVVEAAWFGWAAGAAGLVLVAAGAWWLVANATPPSAPTVRLAGSGSSGRLDVDLGSVASAIAPRFERASPVRSARAVTRRARRDNVVEVRAVIDPRADATALHTAAGGLAAELAHAFPDGEAKGRILLGTGRTRLARDRTPRVR